VIRSPVCSCDAIHRRSVAAPSIPAGGVAARDGSYLTSYHPPCDHGRHEQEERDSTHDHEGHRPLVHLSSFLPYIATLLHLLHPMSQLTFVTLLPSLGKPSQGDSACHHQDEHQQHTARLPTRPASVVQNPMVAVEALLLVQSHLLRTSALQGSRLSGRTPAPLTSATSATWAKTRTA
jgi:hypothetical protein